MKDSYKITIYLTKDSFEEIVLFEDHYPNLNCIFRKCATFVLDMTEDELDTSLEDIESDFAMFCNSNNIKTIAKKSVLQNMLDNKEELTKNCRSLYIVDVDEQTAKEIQDEHGIIVFSKENINDNIFNQSHWRHQFIKNTRTSNDIISEWSDVLKDLVWLPTNSLVLTDNYLFNELSVSFEDRVENIKGLLSAVLPYNLKVDFHILIATRHPTNCNEQKINCAIGKIKAFLLQQRTYPIKIEYIFYETIHQRKIMTNYNIMVGDKGFINLKSRTSRTCEVVGDNTTSSCSVFQNIKDSTGDTEYMIATNDLKSIYKKAQEVKIMHDNKVDDICKRIIGDCNTDKSLKNRLLRSVADV